MASNTILLWETKKFKWLGHFYHMNGSFLLQLKSSRGSLFKTEVKVHRHYKPYKQLEKGNFGYAVLLAHLAHDYPATQQ